ncbi:deazapurine DNA modification protein DpdA family protein [Kitasatospora sp. NPDC054939]
MSTAPGRKALPRAIGPWALDSGAFSEIDLYGRWQTAAKQYAAAVTRYGEEIGNLEWASPQDWVCKPWMPAKTGLSLGEHLRRILLMPSVGRAKPDALLAELAGDPVVLGPRCPPT